MNRRKRSRINPEGYSDKYDPRPRATIRYFGPAPLEPERMTQYVAQASLYADMFEQKRPLPAELWTKEK